MLMTKYLTLRTEFSFDVLQTGKGNYAPQAYHDFIGFKVSKDLVERAFLSTYGLEIKELFRNFDKAIGSFRWAVKNIIPDVTKAHGRPGAMRSGKRMLPSPERITFTEYEG